MVENPLATAARHAMIGARIVAGHRRLIAAMRANGHDTSYAEALLNTFMVSQRIFEDHWLALQKASGLCASTTPVGFLRSEKMERIARAMSAGWLARATGARVS